MTLKINNQQMMPPLQLFCPDSSLSDSDRKVAYKGAVWLAKRCREGFVHVQASRENCHMSN
jgi:hypothetical protein